MMRVALCLHGHFRTFDRCWDGLKKHVIDPYQPDIFAMAWMDHMGAHLHPPSTENPHQHPGFSLDSPPVTPSYVSSVVDRLNPIDLHLDHYHLHDARFTKMVNDLDAYHHPWPHHRPKGTMSLNWIRHVNLEMKKQQEQRQGWKYDRVICTRWDINHPGPVQLEQHDPNVMTLTNVHGPEVTSDIWAAGPSEMMDTWGDQINHIDELVAAGTFNLGTHEWMKAWFIHQGIPWQNRDDIGIFTIR